LIIVPGAYSETLALKLAELLKCEVLNVERKLFPDGESYVRFFDPSKVKGEDVIIVQTTYPEQDKRLMELFLMLDAAKDFNAKNVIAVVPYLAYARQDKRFREGECLSIKSILKLIEASGADAFITVNIHKEESLACLKIRKTNVSAMPLIAEYLKKKELVEPMVFSPDRGAAEYARQVAEILGAEWNSFEKTRDRITGEIKTVGEFPGVNGRDAIIVDDLVSTGGTIANAAKILKSYGARKVYAGFVHALLVSGAFKKMIDSGVDEVVATDTIQSAVSVVSAAPVIAKVIPSIMS